LCIIVFLKVLADVLPLPMWNRVHIRVGFGQKNLGLNLTQCASNIWSTMSAYGGCACSIEVHASRSEVLDPIREVFSLKLEPATKGRVITG